MALLFRQVLLEEGDEAGNGFKGAFDEVIFAILERSGSENMVPWKAVWKGAYDEDDDDDDDVGSLPLGQHSTKEENADYVGIQCGE